MEILSCINYLAVERKVGDIYPTESLEAFRWKPHRRTIIHRHDGDVVFANGLQVLHGVPDGEPGTPDRIRVGVNHQHASVVCWIPGDVLVDPLHRQPAVAHELLLHRIEVYDGHEVEGDGDNGGGCEVLNGTHPGIQRESVLENLAEVFG